MQIFFGDDSVRKGVRGGMGMIVGFGGVLLEDTQLRPLQAAIRAIRHEYKIPLSEELKWSPPRKSWIWNKLIEDKRADCYRRVLEAVQSAGGTTFCVCFDRGRRPVTEQIALRTAVKWCFERVSMCLEDRGCLGLIICDRPGGGHKEADGLLATLLSTIEWGTDFVPPGRVPLNILTTPSHLVHELQVADLVIGVTTAMVAGETKYAEPLFEIVRPMFHKNSLGYAGGAGLKLFPNALLNLHHWVGKENTFWKVAMNSGWTLPREDWPYALNGMNEATVS